MATPYGLSSLTSACSPTTNLLNCDWLSTSFLPLKEVRYCTRGRSGAAGKKTPASLGAGGGALPQPEASRASATTPSRRRGWKDFREEWCMGDLLHGIDAV